MIDIVDELRAQRWDRPPDSLCDEAASEIVALRDEIERLRAALSIKDRHDALDCAAERTKRDIEIERLRAEVARRERILADYMDRVATREGTFFAEPFDWPDPLDRRIVVAALKACDANPEWLTTWEAQDDT